MTPGRSSALALASGCALLLFPAPSRAEDRAVPPVRVRPFEEDFERKDPGAGGGWSLLDGASWVASSAPPCGDEPPTAERPCNKFSPPEGHVLLAPAHGSGRGGIFRTEPAVYADVKVTATVELHGGTSEGRGGLCIVIAGDRGSGPPTASGRGGRAMGVSGLEDSRGTHLDTPTLVFAIESGGGEGLTFDAPRLIPTGREPWSVAVEDFDADGSNDLAAANIVDSQVAVHLSTQDGTFAARAFPTGSAPAYVVAAHVDGDDRVDLVTGNMSTKDVSVLLGKGDGTFEPERRWPAGNGASGLVAADLNGDGRTDIAVANHYESNLSVLLGNGDGTFESRGPFAAGDAVRLVAAADLNGDDHLDLAAANTNAAGSVSVLLGRGDGTFQEQRKVFPGGSLAHGIVATDLNGDRKVDVAVASQVLGALSVLAGNGDGTFRRARLINVGRSPHLVIAADVNDDGVPDLATANGVSNDVSLLLGKGDGTFEAERRLATGGERPMSVAVADLTGDGRSDLVVSNQFSNDLSIFAQRGPSRVAFVYGRTGLEENEDLIPGRAAQAGNTLRRLAPRLGGPGRFLLEITISGGTVSMDMTNLSAGLPRQRMIKYTVVGGIPELTGYLGVTAAAGDPSESYFLHSLRVERLDRQP